VKIPTGLRLDLDTHTYYLHDEVVPGVTTVLQPITDYSDIDPDVLAYKSALGTAVHYATELYDKDILDFDSLDAPLISYVNAWIKFRDDTGFIVELNEHVVYHKRYHYSGMLDRVGLLNGERGVFDIKCVVTLAPHVGVQLAAYQEAENSNRKKLDQIKNRFAIQLKPDGTYRLQPYRERTDFSVFTSLLTLYNWETRHGKH